MPSAARGLPIDHGRLREEMALHEGLPEKLAAVTEALPLDTTIVRAAVHGIVTPPLQSKITGPVAVVVPFKLPPSR